MVEKKGKERGTACEKWTRREKKVKEKKKDYSLRKENESRDRSKMEKCASNKGLWLAPEQTSTG